jgi:hypothetical protein
MFEFLLNQTVLRVSRPVEPVFAICRADGAGLHTVDYGNKVLRPWADVQSVHALSRAPVAADRLALVIAFSDGRVALVGDDEADWLALVLALSEQLCGMPSYADWSSRLQGAPHQTQRLY